MIKIRTKHDEEERKQKQGKKQRKGTYKRIEKGLKEGCVLEVE